MYKIIHDGKVIDVIKHPKFVKFLAFGQVAMTDRSSAQGVVGSDNKTLYSFAPICIKGHDLFVVTVDEIDTAEFSRLSTLLNSDQVVSADEAALAQAKRNKLVTLSSDCKNKIIAGFTVELADGNRYNFKLTTEDQLNLMSIENQLAAGEQYFIYHATSQPCKIYTREDMLKVVRAFRKHVLYHTTYFNAAKHYINSLTDIEKVNLFTYGSDISKTVEDIRLRHILKNGGILA